MGPGIPGRSIKDPNRDSRVKPPRGISDLPRFFGELLGGFFGRLFYTFRLVWQTGPWILFTLIAIAILTGILPLVGSLLSKEILNGLQLVIQDANPAVFFGSSVMLLILFYFLYRLVNQIVTRLNSAVIRIAGEKVVCHVRLIIMEKAKEVDLGSFDLPDFYEKLENANREAGNRPVHIISSTFDIVAKFISLVGYVVIITTAPGMWWMAPVMILLAFPTAVVNFIYRRKYFTYMRHRSKERRQMNYYAGLMVNKDMVKEIRMFDLGDHFTDRYREVFSHYYKGLRGLVIRENLWHIGLTLLSIAANLLFFCFIAMQVFSGKIMIGDFSLYTNSLTSIVGSVSGLITVSATVYEGTLFIDNLIAFTQEKPTVIPTKTPAEPVTSGIPHTIEFRDVSFSYPGSDRPVLKHLNLTIRPGETAVLVGLNGAGKTTFIKLLTRLYDPTEGVILLDGKDLREYDTKELYRLFGIIFQDFGKYAENVSENIHFGDIHRELDDAEIRSAAKQANADDFIDRMPDGYQTPLMRIFEAEGTELSIGQWQKLAIARAFYSSSDILILDEPTASLDPLAEQEVFNQFDALRRDKTTIFVSHRLSSATIATKILVLEYGELVEEGTHRELMEKRGKYYELFSTQAKRYLDGESVDGEISQKP